MYEEKQWRLSPFNSANNINDVGQIDRIEVYSLDDPGGLLSLQERMTRKFVDELKEFDNVYYELINNRAMGYSSAGGVIIFLLIFLFALAYMKFLGVQQEGD